MLKILEKEVFARLLAGFVLYCLYRGIFFYLLGGVGGLFLILLLCIIGLLGALAAYTVYRILVRIFHSMLW